MSRDSARREALEWMKRQRHQHDQQSGKAVPSSREIESWAAEVGRRNDRQDSDRRR